MSQRSKFIKSRKDVLTAFAIRHRMKCAISLLCACTALYFPNKLHAQSYKEITVEHGGTVCGTVKLKNNTSVVERMEISKDTKCCGKMKASPRLTVGKNLGVADAIVYIDNITEGKPIERKTSYTLTQQHCEYSPHTMIIPLGSQLEIVNNDPILHNVHTYIDGAPPQTLFNIAQPVKGLRMKSKPVQKSGILLATCDAGHPWMSAQIMVAKHPYYSVTDKNGNFLFENVPQGTYQVRLWHEGVNITKKNLEQGKISKYEFEQCYEDSVKVTVSQDSKSIANFELQLR